MSPWPPLVMLSLMVLGLGLELEANGKPKTGNRSIGWALFGATVTATILYWGGFWDPLLKR